MQIKILAFFLAYLAQASAFRLSARGLQVPRFTRSSMSSDDADKGADTPEQDVKDLNLEEMFDVFEAAEQADGSGKVANSSGSSGSSTTTPEKSSFPDFSDPQDWITIGLVLLIIKNTADIISEWIAK